MDFYKDKTKRIDDIDKLIKEEDEALVTLERQSHKHYKSRSFVCHGVLLALLIVVGMCSFAFLANYGFQLTGCDQQSLNGGLLILLFTQVHWDAYRKSKIWRLFSLNVNRRLCIKVGWGHRDGDIATRVWGLGTEGRETRDLRTSSMGRGYVWDGDTDAGTSKNGMQGTRDMNNYCKSRS